MGLDFMIFSEVIVRKSFEVDDRKWRGRPNEGWINKTSARVARAPPEVRYQKQAIAIWMARIFQVSLHGLLYGLGLQSSQAPRDSRGDAASFHVAVPAAEIAAYFQACYSGQSYTPSRTCPTGYVPESSATSGCCLVTTT